MMLFAQPVHRKRLRQSKSSRRGKIISKEEELTLRLLREIDINTLTPVEAMMKLNELKKILN